MIQYTDGSKFADRIKAIRDIEREEVKVESITLLRGVWIKPNLYEEGDALVRQKHSSKEQRYEQRRNERIVWYLPRNTLPALSLLVA